MSAKVVISAKSKSVIEITLPDGLSVNPAKPVPIEVLEMLVAFARAQRAASEAGPGDPEAGWCFGGCGAQDVL